MNRFYILILVMILPALQCGCAALYGYDIHAQGALSSDYFEEVSAVNGRIGLYMPESLTTYVSDDKGNWYSDPQTYYVGEGMMPMMIEGFQHSFSEVILFEEEPSAEKLREYSVPMLAVVDLTGFDNIKTFPGQTLEVKSKTTLYNSELELVTSFEALGSSRASKVFNKKGGPEINLNSALENNVKATMQYLIEYLVREQEQTA